MNKLSLDATIKLAERTPTDFKFIHSVASPVCKNLGVVIHEDLPDKPELKDILKGRDAVCILFTVLHGDVRTSIAHWCALFRGKKNKVTFFDSLAIGLKAIYGRTTEKPKVLWALRNTNYERSHRPVQRLIRQQKYCGCACAVRLRFYKTKTNHEFENYILNYAPRNPGVALATLCLFHYTDQNEYKVSDVGKKANDTNSK